ncbi:MAG: hypothetical protein HY318_09890 [Armatimonadetes bacterium]|nr:hypothetical protein [Armatimonadota bacterium]
MFHHYGGKACRVLLYISLGRPRGRQTPSDARDTLTVESVEATVASRRALNVKVYGILKNTFRVKGTPEYDAVRGIPTNRPKSEPAQGPVPVVS